MRLPISGTASLVLGIISDTMFINTVRESKIVTPEIVARFLLRYIERYTQGRITGAGVRPHSPAHKHCNFIFGRQQFIVSLFLSLCRRICVYGLCTGGVEGRRVEYCSYTTCRFNNSSLESRDDIYID